MSNNNKMLIDATHPEETRVVVLRNGRVEEFDFESAARKLLRGNIYLAKVTRVEPSLQAAFVDYGGNRHGFLAFNEIHPDYYQIPVADRQALIEEEAAQEAAEEAEVDAHAERLARRRQRGSRPSGGPSFEPASNYETGPGYGHPSGEAPAGDAVPYDTDEPHHTIAVGVGEIEQIISEPPPPVIVGGFEPDHVHDNGDMSGEPGGSLHGGHADGEEEAAAHHEAGEGGADADDVASGHAHGHDEPRGEHHAHSVHDESHQPRHAVGHHEDGEREHADAEPAAAPELIEPAGSDDMVEELVQRPRRRMRSYKIQEVIKRRQIILVQVVKEERGNKGAALTTYLSLAGRYTVLMPNTARGGGISRKITQPGDRKRLKAIANELEVPEGMGLIIRTAGAARTSQEIKRDFEYLLRLWESVRQLTLESTAPSLVYEEGNLIKRSIRDLYNKDVEEIVVAGEPSYREAHDFMRMLMPSHAKNVIHYKGAEPLFTRFRMEQQLAAMFSPQVTLKSGGYLVINQTEALVAIDVNSGKSTREYSIEETALNTNLEAADEIARQLKLRDLAGLIVIDFIDMEEKRNNRNVERRLKDALRFDRARIQLGRISHFGLMEMSRQRLRTGVLEGSTSQCPHCQGTGIIRSIESIALAVIRGLEDTLMSGTRMALIATTTPQVALYILNAKRAYITDMEARHGLAITVQGSDKLQGANFTIDKVAATTAETPLRRRSASAVNMEWGFDGDEGEEPATEGNIVDVVPSDEAEDEGDDREPRGEAGSEGDGGEEVRRKRRRRGRRGRRDERTATEPPFAEGASAGYDEDGPSGGGESNIVEIGSDEGEPEDIGADGGDEDGHAAGRSGQPVGGEGEGQGRRGRRRGRRGGRRGGQNRERAPFAANDRNAHGPEDDAVQPTAGEDTEHGAQASQPAGDGDHDVTRPRHGVRDVMRTGSAIETGAAPEHPAATAEAPAAASEMTQHNRRSRPHDEPAPVATPAPEPAATAVATATVPPHGQATAPAADQSPVAAPVAPPAAPHEVKPRRVASTSSEPVLERVVVTPHAGAASSTSEPETKPNRKGWWQRKLGID